MTGDALDLGELRERLEAVEAHVAACEARELAVRERNLRVIKHEIETPTRSHDDDGECCRRAARGDRATP